MSFRPFRIYQGYSPVQAKDIYSKLSLDMGRYGQVFKGKEIKNFIETPFDIIKTKALIVIDNTENKDEYGQESEISINWNVLLNKLYSNWKDEYRCSILIFTNDHISKTLIRDDKVEYKHHTSGNVI